MSDIPLSELLAIEPPQTEPVDFADFWRRSYDEALKVDLAISIREISHPNPSVVVHEIEFNSTDGVRIGGWLTIPAGEQKIRRGMVVGHGYGGRAEPEPSMPGPPAAVIFPCARGFNRSSHESIPGHGSWHVLHGIKSRETYSHRGCAGDLWCAASALLELYPEVAPQLDYQGGSFGGGIGALAVPWDRRFRRASLNVPSFGNHPLRLQTPCNGSGEAVRMYHQRHPEVTEVLRYFDAATAATHFEIPVFVAAALSDPAVPPVGQFCVYNSIRSPKELYVRTTGHPCIEEESKEVNALLNEWYAQP